jgi:hypothetical protein
MLRGIPPQGQTPALLYVVVDGNVFWVMRGVPNNKHAINKAQSGWRHHIPEQEEKRTGRLVDRHGGSRIPNKSPFM